MVVCEPFIASTFQLYTAFRTTWVAVSFISWGRDSDGETCEIDENSMKVIHCDAILVGSYNNCI
jgi:hypothetical protein